MPQVGVRDGRVLFADVDVEVGVLPLVRRLVDGGAGAIQLRDVDGVAAVGPVLPLWMTALISEAGVPVQLDAALEDAQAIERAARERFSSIVVGQGAVMEPLMLRWAHDLLGDRRLVVELRLDGEYLYDPPAGHAGMTVGDAAHLLCQQSVRRVLVRDMTGLEMPLRVLRELAGDRAMRVSFHGLIRTVGDIVELAACGDGMEAAIIGEPILDGRIGIEEANRAARSSR